MPDYITYPKPQRLPLNGLTNKKNVMASRDARFMLSGRVAVEEKMDGRLVQFAVADPALIVMAEDLRRMHSIAYRLPGRYAIFDIFNTRRNVFLYRDEKASLAMEMRRGQIKIDSIDPILFFPVPLLASGKFEMADLMQFVGRTAYAITSDKKREPAFGEGIVVKPYCDQFMAEFLAGKIVRAEFSEGISANYFRLPVRFNVIDPLTPLPAVAGVTDLLR